MIPIHLPAISSLGWYAIAAAIAVFARVIWEEARR